MNNFASIVSKGLFLNERICSQSDKCFPFREDPFQKEFGVQKKQTGDKSCLPWKKGQKIYQVYKRTGTELTTVVFSWLLKSSVSLGIHAAI